MQQKQARNLPASLVSIYLLSHLGKKTVFLHCEILYCQTLNNVWKRWRGTVRKASTGLGTGGRKFHLYQRKSKSVVQFFQLYPLCKYTAWNCYASDIFSERFGGAHAGNLQVRLTCVLHSRSRFSMHAETLFSYILKRRVVLCFALSFQQW